MLRRFMVVLGMVTIGVGFYYVIADHAKNAACNVNEGKFVGFGMSGQCQTIVWTYFAGFALIVLGLFVVTYGMLLLRREDHRVVHREHRPDPNFHWREFQVPRGAAPPAPSPVPESEDGEPAASSG